MPGAQQRGREVQKRLFFFAPAFAAIVRFNSMRRRLTFSSAVSSFSDFSGSSGFGCAGSGSGLDSFLVNGREANFLPDGDGDGDGDEAADLVASESSSLAFDLVFFLEDRGDGSGSADDGCVWVFRCLRAPILPSLRLGVACDGDGDAELLPLSLRGGDESLALLGVAVADLRPICPRRWRDGVWAGGGEWRPSRSDASSSSEDSDAGRT